MEQEVGCLTPNVSRTEISDVIPLFRASTEWRQVVNRIGSPPPQIICELPHSEEVTPSITEQDIIDTVDEVINDVCSDVISDDEAEEVPLHLDTDRGLWSHHQVLEPFPRPGSALSEALKLLEDPCAEFLKHDPRPPSPDPIRYYPVIFRRIKLVGRLFFMEAECNGHEYNIECRLHLLTKDWITPKAREVIAHLCANSQRKLKLLDVVASKLYKSYLHGVNRHWNQKDKLNSFLEGLDKCFSSFPTELPSIHPLDVYNAFLKQIVERSASSTFSPEVYYKKLTFSLEDFDQVSSHEIPCTVYTRIRRDLDDYQRFKIETQSGEKKTSRQKREDLRRNADKKKKAEEAKKNSASNKKRKTQQREYNRQMKEILQQAGFKETVSGILNTVTSYAWSPFVVAKNVSEASESFKDAAENIADVSRRATTTVNKVDDAADAIKQAAETLERDVNHVAIMASDTNDAVAETLGTTNDLLRKLSNMFSGLHKFFSDNLPKMLVATLFVAFVWWICQHCQAPIMKQLVLAATSFKLGSTTIEDFQEDIVQQSGGIASSTLPKLIATTLIGVLLSSKKSTYYSSISSHVIDSLGRAPRAFNGIESLFEFVIGLVEKAVNSVRAWLDMPQIKFSTLYGRKVDDLCHLIIELEKREMNNDELQVSAMERFNDMRCAYMDLQDCFGLFSENKEATNFLKSLERKLRLIMDPLMTQIGAGQGSRPMPTTVMLYGKPGVGKTSQVLALSCAILKIAGKLSEDSTEETAHRSVFVKAHNTTFWDGYWGQPMLLIDDLFAKKPQPSDEANAFMDIMTIVSSFTTMLNMAKLENKGKWPFTSPLVMMTTNMQTMAQVNSSQILLNDEAFKRRIDFHYEVVVKKEFRVGGDGPDRDQLCWEKFSREQTRCQVFAENELAAGRKPNMLLCYPFHVWELHPADFTERPTPEGPGISFLTLISEIASTMKSREVYHQKSKDTMATMMRAAVPTPEEIDAMVLAQARSRDSEIQPQAGMKFNCETPEDREFLAKTFAEETINSLQKNTRPQAVASVLTGVQGAVDAVKDTAAEVVTIDERMFDNSLHDVQDSVDTIASKINEYKDKASRGFDSLKSKAAYVAEKLDDFGNHYVDAVKGDHSKFWQRFMDEEAADRLSLTSSAMAFGAFIGTALVAGKLILTGAISLIVKLARGMWEWFQEQFFGTTVQQSTKQKSKVIKTAISYESGLKEGYTLAEKCYDNTYKLLIRYSPEVTKVLGQILFLGGDYFVMPAHFLSELKEELAQSKESDVTNPLTLNTNLELLHCGPSDHKHIMSVGNFLKYPFVTYHDRDLTFGRLTDTIALKPQIYKFLATDKDRETLGNKAVKLDVARLRSMDNPIKDKLSFMTPSLHVGYQLLHIAGRKHEDWFSYTADTHPGDCGAPLFLQDHSAYQCRVLLGIHIARRSKSRTAYATALTQELFTDAKSRLPQGSVEILSHRETYEQSGIKDYGLSAEETREMPFEIEEGSGEFGSMQPVCILNKQVNSPISTNLQETAMGAERTFEDVVMAYHGDKPEVLELMRLAPYYKDGVRMYPMLEALKPFATDTRSINVDLWNDSLSIALQPFNDATTNHMARKLTFEEAVLGVKEIGLSSIPRSTSMGIPLGFRYKTKKDIFGSEMDFDLTTPAAIELKKDVLALEKLLEEGKRPFFMCRGFLKDEVRKKGKSARYIAGVDLRYYILCRMYFGTYVAALSTNYKASGLCSTINPYQDWQWLWHHITKNGEDVWDGDFKGFDSSEQAQMLWGVCHAMNKWYFVRAMKQSVSKDTIALENNVRKILFMDLVYSRHVVSSAYGADHVVQWQKSLPSGHFLTSTVNSIISMGCVVSGYIITTQRTDFWTQASAATCGDDNVVGASREVLPEFNQVTLAKHLKDYYDMVYTSGKKGADLVESLTMDDVVFLQRRFCIKNGKVVCPIRPESFLNSLYYTKKGTVEYKEKVLWDGIENALSELSMHEEKLWDMAMPRLAHELDCLGKSPKEDVSDSTAYLRITLERKDPGFI